MIEITFISAVGTAQSVQVAPGTSLMQAATSHGIDGIAGECGGSAMCATCHCYIDEAFVDKLPPISAVENEMLEATASERLPTSRLGCQVKVTEALAGLIIRLPETQV